MELYFRMGSLSHVLSAWEIKPHHFPFCGFNRVRATNLLWSIWGCLGEQVTPESGDKQGAVIFPRNPCQLFYRNFAGVVFTTGRGEEIIHCPFCHCGWGTGALRLCRLGDESGIVTLWKPQAELSSSEPCCLCSGAKMVRSVCKGTYFILWNAHARKTDSWISQMVLKTSALELLLKMKYHHVL